MNIGELADAAGVTRRAVHFYINRGLLLPALSRGRSAMYDATHLARLRDILRLQAAGHSLDAIARLLALRPTATAGPNASPSDPATVCEPPGPGPGTVTPPAREPIVRLQAQLLVRLRLAEGVELVLDARRHNPDAGQLLALRECVLNCLHLNKA